MPARDDLPEQITALIASKLPDGTWLSSVDESSDDDYGTLQKIEIQKSSIDKIDPGYFANLAGRNKLKKLMLRAVTGSVVVDKAMLQGLTKSLTHLSVLSSIRVDLEAVSDLDGLTELEIVNANIVGNPSSLAMILRNLRSLTVSHTNISTLPWDALTQWVEEDKTRSVKIFENEWNCDCSMAAIKRLPSSLSKRYAFFIIIGNVIRIGFASFKPT